jgi:hypothetical protein
LKIQVPSVYVLAKSAGIAEHALVAAMVASAVEFEESMG